MILKLKSSQTQALWQPIFPAFTNSLIKGFFNEFCYVITNFKQSEGRNYNFILVIVDWLMKMVHFELVKVTINAFGLVEVIFDMIVWYHSLSN